MVESDPNQDEPVSDPTSNGNSATEKEKKIIRQVEYYFGDFNLVKDKFLQEKIKEDDGWVTLTTLLTFKRLANISNESKDIVAALEKSTSNLLEIHDTKEKIRRSPKMPLPEMNEERRKELMERTVYCKGFPVKSELNDLLEFFYKYGDVENVAMRSWNDKATKEWHFKGSVFVIFKTVSGAEEFLKLESVKYNDTDLIRKWQKDYIEDKRKERLENRIKHNKKSKNQDKKKIDKKGEAESNCEPDGKNEGKDGGGDKEDDEEKDEDERFATGTVVELSGIDFSIKWENIKERIEELGISVAFIEFTPGSEVAFVRLTNKDTAPELAKLVAKDDNKLKVCNKELHLRVVEGEEEATYLEKQKEMLMKKRNAAQKKKNMNKKGRGGRGRSRGGRWEGKRRRGASPEDEPPSKCKAIDDATKD